MRKIRSWQEKRAVSTGISAPVVSVAASSDEEMKEEEVFSSSEEEEEEEEDVELLAMRFRSEWQALSNKLADFHGPSSARVLLRERLSRAGERMMEAVEQLPYLSGEDMRLQKWLACGKPGLKYVDLARSFTSTKLLVTPDKIRWCLKHEDLSAEERVELEERLADVEAQFAITSSVATCTITPSEEFVRPSFSYVGHMADPDLEAKQGLPICEKRRRKVFYDFWVDPQVDYKNPGYILRCAMGMDPLPHEKRVLFEWAAGVSRHWKKWLEEPIPQACRACGQPTEECTCDCECEHRDHKCL